MRSASTTSSNVPSRGGSKYHLAEGERQTITTASLLNVKYKYDKDIIPMIIMPKEFNCCRRLGNSRNDRQDNQHTSNRNSSRLLPTNKTTTATATTIIINSNRNITKKIHSVELGARHDDHDHLHRNTIMIWPLSSYDHGGKTPVTNAAQLVLNRQSNSLTSTSLTFMRTINAKEIDSKQDLQEEESTNLPAEHRTYLTAAPGPTGYQVANSQNRQLYLTTSGHPVQPGAHQHHHSVSHPHHVHSGSELSPNHVYIDANGAPPPQESNLYGNGQAGSATGALVAPQNDGGSSGQPGGSVGSGVASSEAESSAWPLVRSDLPHIRALNVKCEKNHMTVSASRANNHDMWNVHEESVNIVFDRPFNGLVFSKGHYSDAKCVHLPANSGQTSVNFDIHLGQCGMSSSDASGNTYPHSGNGQTSLAAGGAASQGQPNGLYIENTIIIQYDAQVQEIWDQARKLRCTWYDYYEKSVTFRPYNVDMLDAVTANFLGDNIQCWMQIQVGKGPWSSEVAGIVKIGQTMTMVLAIKDDENKFDMLVRNCVAHDGNHKHQPIQLVDEYGCVARPKIMARFQKVRNFGPAATVVSYAYFQAFKFPDSMNVHFQCVIQVCRYECPEPACDPVGSPPGLGGSVQGGPPAASVSGDYATSGTEIVTHKEPLPPVGQSYHHHHGMAISTGPVISDQASTGMQTIKIEENQGRAQVKLDTSMIAGSTPATTGGALPPHLLHASQATSPLHQVPNQYSKQQMVYTNTQAQHHRQHQPVPNLPNHLPYSTMVKQNIHTPHQPAMMAPHAAYTNRQGDSESDTTPMENQRMHTAMAMPRSMRFDDKIVGLGKKSPNVDRRSTRKRRQVAIDGLNESTQVKTMKTIQVVSPGDVAFSLISNANDTYAALYESIINGSHMDETSLNGSAKHGSLMDKRKGEQYGFKSVYKDYQSTICFTTTRFLFIIIISLVLLTFATCSAIFALLRQRSKFIEKMSAAYDTSPPLSSASDCRYDHRRM